MDYNAKIHWTTGMMLNTEIFRQMEEDFSVRQRIAIRSAIGTGHFGVLPDMPLNINGVFVRRTYEMTGLQCTAVLPSGRIISADGDFVLPISLKSKDDADYYVTLEYGEETKAFERDGVPYTAPQVILALRTPEEVEQEDVLPLKHFYVEDGTLNVEDDYILPTLCVATEARYADYINRIAESLTKLASHENMDNGECKRSLMHFAFRLRAFNKQRSTWELLDIFQELVQALDFYFIDVFGSTLEKVPDAVMELNGNPNRELRIRDIVTFLKWLERYITIQSEIMSLVVIEEPVIDIEAIKLQVKEAIYPELFDALYQKLLDQLRQQLSAELPPPIIEEVKRVVEENLRPILRTDLYEALRDPLYNDLYEALMAAVKDMLSNFEFKEVDNFMPII